MANMSYCKFQNTLSDLADCKETLLLLLSEMWEDPPEPLSAEELRAAKALVQECCDIVTQVAAAAGVEEESLSMGDNIDATLDKANADATEAKGAE